MQQSSASNNPSHWERNQMVIQYMKDSGVDCQKKFLICRAQPQTHFEIRVGSRPNTQGRDLRHKVIVGSECWSEPQTLNYTTI